MFDRGEGHSTKWPGRTRDQPDRQSRPSIAAGLDVRSDRAQLGANVRLGIKPRPTGGLEVSVTLPRYRPPHGIADAQSASEPSRAILSTSAERH